MSKRPLEDYPRALHFVTFSTYQRRRFLAPERTKSIVVESLQSALTTQRASCHGFVVMPDHVHALLSVVENSTIAAFLMAWKKTSSYRIKKFYEQEFDKYLEHCLDDCPVWQARFYDFLVESDHKLPEKIQYIHDNPVAAGLAVDCLSWKWSSARYYELEEAVGVKITPIR
jgi:putative transposase